MINSLIKIRDEIANLRLIDWFWIYVGMAIFPTLFCICGMVVNIFRDPPPPLEVNVTVLSLCKGWNQEGLPINLSEPVPVDTERLLVCGHIQSNRQQGTLAVNWYYEGTYVDRDVISNVKDSFSSDLIPSEGRFKEGTYEVKVFAGREEIGHLKFRMENP